MRFSLLAFAIFVLQPINGNASPSEVSAIAEQTVIRVLSENRGRVQGGSGFIISREGHVVTNQHVLANPEKTYVLIKNTGGKPKLLKAKIVWSSRELDLAVLEVEGLSGSPLVLSTAQPEKGSVVYTVGFPGIADAAIDTSKESWVESTITQGIIGRLVSASWEDKGKKLDVIQHSASVNSGNSGGPLFNACGQVIGVNTAKALGSLERDTDNKVAVNQADGIYFASNVRNLISEIPSRNIKIRTTNDNCLDQISRQSSQKKENFSATTVVAFLAGLAGIFIGFLAIQRKIRSAYRGAELPNRHSSERALSVEYSPKIEEELLILEGRLVNGTLIRLKLASKKLLRGITLGRDDSVCDHTIVDPTISRTHVKLSLSNSKLVLEDLNSTNGTFIDSTRVNGARAIEKRRFNLRLGKVIFQCSWGRS